jgi:hypothetical protein
MHVMIPTWLIFVFLVIASFAPVVSLRPAWWIPYYVGLLACWIATVIAALRRARREERAAHQEFVRTLRRLQDEPDDVDEREEVDGREGRRRAGARRSTREVFRRRGGLPDPQPGGHRGGR